MSPRRPSVSGLNFSTWMRTNAGRAVRHYKKRASPSSGSHTSPKTAASLARLRNRAKRTVATLQGYNSAVLARNQARIKKMLKEISNYEARHRHKLVRQPSGSYSLARRT
jgi:rubrerythrin